jgi:hypothetical protein
MAHAGKRSPNIGRPLRGSIAKGQALVATGGGETTACHLPRFGTEGRQCHARDRRPAYWLYCPPALFFQNGSRSGPAEALMHSVVQRLTIDNMLAIAAYVASRAP